MGTRSLTYVYGDSDVGSVEPIICLYRQFDGYPSGHGLELAEFLAPINIVNGIGMGDARVEANGMGCLAAQIVANFKVCTGNFYLQAPQLNVDSWQEYEYHVFQDRVLIYHGQGAVLTDLIFEGDWSAFKAFCSKEESNNA